jgi:hypothetical protein
MTIFKKSIVALTLLTTFIGSERAFAGPPFVTDDPEPVEFKHWEVYFFTLYNHASGGAAAQIPALEVNYGVAEDMQLHLVAPITYVRQSGSNAHYGYGDTELGLKYRFIHETDTLPQVAVFPLVEVPTGNSGRGLGNGQAQVFLPIWMQKSFGQDRKWTTFGGGGFWYNPGHDHRNFYRVGWELQHEFSEHVTLGAEIFHETAAFRDSTGHTAFNVGGYFNINEHQHILATIGRDIESQRCHPTKNRRLNESSLRILAIKDFPKKRFPGRGQMTEDFPFIP